MALGGRKPDSRRVQRQPCWLPLPVIAVASISGILGAASRQRFWILPSLAFLLLFVCRFCRFHIPWLKIAIPAVFLISACRTCLIFLPAEKQADSLAGQSFWLEGTVSSQIARGGFSVRVLIQQAGGPAVALWGPAHELVTGRKIRLLVRAERPSGRVNPGGPDDRQWLAGMGVFLSCERLDGAVCTILKREPVINLAAWSQHWRGCFFTMAARLLEPDEAALLSGLVLGDTSHLDKRIRADFRKSGLAHLTSVSGANVGYAKLPVSLIFKKGRFGRQKRLWGLLAVLVCFGTLTGWPVSVTRAIVMAGTAITGSLLHRRADPINSLAFSAILLTLLQPLSVLSVGFWLSAAATAGILIFSETATLRIQGRIPILPRWLCSTLAVTLCAQASVLPLTCSIGQPISLVGLLTNMPAMPLACGCMMAAPLILPASWLGQCQNSICKVFSQGIGMPLAILLKALIRLARLAGQIEAGRISKLSINAAFWFFGFLVLVYWARKHHRGPFSKAIARCPDWLMKFRMPSLLAWLLLTLVLQINQPQVQVWFLAVGQGDAILLRSREGFTVLVDGGKPGSGSDIVEPALDSLGFGQIDLAVATHGHDDHAGGLIELVDCGRIQELVVPQGFTVPSATGGETDLAQELVDASRKAGIRVSELARNDTIALGSLIFLRALHPDRCDPGDNLREGIPKNLADGNERCLILQAELAGLKLLLTADCTAETEAELVEESAWPAADFLKVAHHGSRLATSDLFLQAVQPLLAIISVGPNVYGHPSPDTIRRLGEAGSLVLRTDRQGAVRLCISGCDWFASTWLE